MLYTLPLNKKFPHRVACDVYFGKDRERCIVDTGCMNTLIPLSVAKDYGRPLNKKYTVAVGGRVYHAVAYVFDNFRLDGFLIPRLVAFCADFEGTLKNNVLLGLNVLNSLEYAISRNRHSLSFDVDIWALVEDKKYPFSLFFDMEDGMKPVYPSLLIED